MKIFRTLLAALLTFALTSPPAMAQKRRTQVSPPPVAQQQRPQAELMPVRPALYVARDADSEIFLFGTIHIRRPGSDWGGPAAQAALARAEEVWTEMDMSDESQMAAAHAMAAQGLSLDRPLSSRLTPEQYARLEAAAQRLDVPVAMFNQMRPWMAGLMLSVLPMVQAGYDPEAGVDQAVAGVAPAAARRRAFETAEQQIGFFSALSEEAEIEFLLDAIDGVDGGVAELDSMADAWAAGDVETLQRLAVDEARELYPELHEVILVRRNAAWVETLMQELEGEGVDFVAVGAAHLLGDESVIAMLRARGVRVERVE